jgi:nitrous oxide reductase accessory protein NosL
MKSLLLILSIAILSAGCAPTTGIQTVKKVKIQKNAGCKVALTPRKYVY